MTIEVYVRDRDRRLVGVLDEWTDLSLSLRYNDSGSWQITVPLGTSSRRLATAGAGALFRRNGLTLMSGPTTTYSEQWGANDPGAGTLVVSGRDDLVHLAREIAEPDPLVVGTPTKDYDRITGVAETVIRSYVSRNIGIDAKAGRTRHVLGQTPNLAAGTSVTGNARYDNLLDLVKSLALAGGVGFRATQDVGGIAPLFDVFTPQDRSQTVVFSRSGGSLIAYDYTLSAPAVTRALVAGQGVGAARTLVEVTSANLESDWDVVARVFIDRRDTNDTGDLTQEGATAVIEGGATAGLAVTPVDLPSQTYGVHYGLGDIVSVDTDETTRITDVLVAVNFTAKVDGGEVVSPVVGFGELGEIPALFAVLRRLGTRVGLLEKRV